MVGEFCLNKNDSFVSCHASSLCELPDGGFLVCCFAGKHEWEGLPGQIVLGSRRAPQAEAWEEDCVLVNVPGHAAGNPRVFRSPDPDEYWLIAPVTYGEWCSGGTRLFMKRSRDGGYTWTDLEMITEQKGVLGKNKPLTEEGICLLPVEQEETWSAKFLRTEDAGKTWEIFGDLGTEAGVRIIQPALAKLRNGEILALMRSQENFVYASRSTDRGKTWSRAVPTNLPNNNSGLDVVRLESGNLVVVFNPTCIDSKPEKKDPGLPDRLPVGFHTWGPRTPLVAALSRDDGENWDCVVDLEIEQGAFSYPAVIQARDESIHITYTYNRKRIKHVQLREEEFFESVDGEKYSWCEARSRVTS